jgi:hypothetical protein
VLVYLLWPSSEPKPQAETGPNKQSYSSLQSYKLAGAKAGQGLGFSRPAEYKLISVTKDKTQANFSDSIKKPPVYAPLGSIWLDSSAYPSSPDKLKSYFSSAFSSSTNPNYQQALSGLEKFVSDRFSPLYDLTYASIQPLTTTNIKTGAWAFNFSAAPKSKYASSPNLESYKGQLVFALGHNAYYYLMAYATNYNWDNNQPTWSQVTNSISIDQ